ncbi:hypothetical protein HDU93_002746 [Gonapodya sp. JEL0774]|nr:hypothetical protein HDU93_002746 [Gonapodya sp. JEL0774]
MTDDRTAQNELTIVQLAPLSPAISPAHISAAFSRFGRVNRVFNPDVGCDFSNGYVLSSGSRKPRGETDKSVWVEMESLNAAAQCMTRCVELASEPSAAIDVIGLRPSSIPPNTSTVEAKYRDRLLMVGPLPIMYDNSLVKVGADSKLEVIEESESTDGDEEDVAKKVRRALRTAGGLSKVKSGTGDLVDNQEVVWRIGQIVTTALISLQRFASVTTILLPPFLLRLISAASTPASTNLRTVDFPSDIILPVVLKERVAPNLPSILRREYGGEIVKLDLRSPTGSVRGELSATVRTATEWEARIHAIVEDSVREFEKDRDIEQGLVSIGVPTGSASTPRMSLIVTGASLVGALAEDGKKGRLGKFLPIGFSPDTPAAWDRERATSKSARGIARKKRKVEDKEYAKMVKSLSVSEWASAANANHGGEEEDEDRKRKTAWSARVGST